MSRLEAQGAGRATGTVMANMRIQQLVHGKFGGHLTGHTQVSVIGRTSFTCTSALFHQGHCVALSEATQVAIDDSGAPREIDQTLRYALQRLSGAAPNLKHSTPEIQCP